MKLALENLRIRIAQAWQRRAITLKAASFATIGLINTAVDAAIFFLLLAFVTTSLAVENVSALLVAVSGSYVMNSFTTFSAETGGKLRLRDYAGFVASGTVAVAATTITVVIAANYMRG